MKSKRLRAKEEDSGEYVKADGTMPGLSVLSSWVGWFSLLSYFQASGPSFSAGVG